MQSMHNRVYVPGIVDLLPTPLKNLKGLPQEEIEKLLKAGLVLKNAPFLWINLIYRFGTKNDLKIGFGRISKKYGDLPLALELNSKILIWSDSHNIKLFEDIFMVAALEALIAVCKKYKLPDDVIRAERVRYRDIPETVDACERMDRLLIA